MLPPLPARAVVFDLDGTLLDSAADIHASISHALAADGHAAPQLDELRGWIGRPLVELFAQFAPGGDATTLTTVYRRHVVSGGHRRTRPFPGTLELLDELRDAGWTLAVATTKTTVSARAALTQLGLQERFDHVQGTDGFPCKPAPDVVEHALIGLGLHDVDRAMCWMVGDTVHDIAAGRAAGLSTAAVTSGAHSRELLLGCGADLVIDDLKALAGHLRAM
jgi:phosphoglycolate phosphatase